MSTQTNDYSGYYGAYLSEYLAKTNAQDTRINYILAFIIICIMLALLGVSKPIFAKTPPPNEQIIAQVVNEEVYTNEQFRQNIKEKYKGLNVTFPNSGVAHIKKVKYINSKPIKINIIEINTKVNKNLRIKPQTAGVKLNSKSSVRSIAKKQNAIIAINGGFFKPQTGVPLGALMIDGEVLSGPIYNRVGIAIFEKGNKTTFKMQNIDFDIKAITKNNTVKIDNINQPRMLATHTLMYTSAWSKISPPPPKNGYNALIVNNNIVKISANAIEIPQGATVIQGSKELISKLGKDREIHIDIQLQDELKNAKHIIGAGPYLVKNSQIYTDYKEQKLQAISGKNPRSAIGYKDDGTFIFVTVDGREQSSVGMTLFELASLMKDLGVEQAMNFDGGSSSALYLNGKIVNTAVNKEGIRVSNALTVIELQNDELQISGL